MQQHIPAAGVKLENYLFKEGWKKPKLSESTLEH